MKVFLVANTYSTHLIASNLSFVTDGYVTELILLKEVVLPQDTILNCDVSIKIYDSIEDALNSCNQIWIVLDEILSTKKIDIIKKSAARKNKTVFEFVDPWAHSSNANLHESSRKLALETRHKIPSIRILSFGKWTQLYSVETFFTKMLLKHSANVFCEFSSLTKNFLDQLNKMGILNPEISLCNSLKCPDVILQGSESKALDYSDKGWKDAYSIFQSQADIVFLLLDGCFLNYDNIDEMKNIFSYKCGVVPEQVMISNFRDLNISESQCKYMKYLDDRVSNRQDMIGLNNADLLHCFEESIVKIITPQGISWVNSL